MHVLGIADAELPLPTEFHTVAFAARDTWLSIPRDAFLGSSIGLPPPVPSASLLSLGFHKIDCHLQTQSSMEWQLPCLMFVLCERTQMSPRGGLMVRC
jgi:hypothetical protein